MNPENPNSIDTIDIVQYSLRYYFELLVCIDKYKCTIELEKSLLLYKDNFDLYHIIQGFVGEKAMTGMLNEPNVSLRFLRLIKEQDWAYKRVLARYLISTVPDNENTIHELLDVFIFMNFEWAVIELIPKISNAKRKELLGLTNEKDFLTRTKRLEVKGVIQELEKDS